MGMRGPGISRESGAVMGIIKRKRPRGSIEPGNRWPFSELYFFLFHYSVAKWKKTVPFWTSYCGLFAESHVKCCLLTDRPFSPHSARRKNQTGFWKGSAPFVRRPREFLSSPSEKLGTFPRPNTWPEALIYHLKPFLRPTPHGRWRVVFPQWRLTESFWTGSQKGFGNLYHLNMHWKCKQ